MGKIFFSAIAILIMALGASATGQVLSSKKFATNEQRTKYFLEEYTLHSGDNISTVAKAYGLKERVLVWFNGLKDPKALKAGQTISIPDPNFYYWLFQGVDRYGNHPVEDALSEFSMPDTVKNLFLEILSKDQPEHSYLKNGQYLEEMAGIMKHGSGFKVEVKQRVVCVFETGEVYSAQVYRDTVGDQVYILANPQVCNNWCWWTTAVTNEKPPCEEQPPCDNPPCFDTTVEYETLTVVIDTCALDTGVKVDSTVRIDTLGLIKTQVVESTTVVSTPPPEKATPPVSTKENGNLTNRDELFLWVGHYFPLPVVVDGHNYYGGKYNHFFGSPKNVALGFNLGVGGWDGYGPKPEWSRYVGFSPFLGLNLDVVSGKSRVTFFADYAWQYEHGWTDSGYVATQTSQFFCPGLSFVVNSPNSRRWLEGWLDTKWDFYHLKKSEYQHVGLTRAQDPPGNKSSVFFGMRYYFLDISTKKTPMMLGMTLKASHLFEDHRFEIGGGPSWSINYFMKFGLEYKETFHSSVPKQDGGSIAVNCDVDVLNFFR